MKTDNNKLNQFGLLVADHVNAMLAYWDKDLVCRFANAAYIHWFGVGREEMVDKMTIFELLGPLYEKNLPYITEVLKGNPQTFEREIPNKQNGIRYSLANYFPDIKNGKVQGFFVHVADITSIKLMEKELVKSIEVIGEQNRRLMNFSNIISHNLRSYAHNFEGMLSIFSEAKSVEKQADTIDMLKSISRNFVDTVNNLTEIVHVQNMSDIKLEQINLNDYILKAISSLSFQISSSNAKIINTVSADLEITGNSAYLENILVNLITNAIKYKHPQRNPVIELACSTINNEILFTVKDNGCGINLDKYGNDLFGLYKTFHGNSDAQGIGLYITRYQIEAMSGKIEVESKVDNGTKFTIHFMRNKSTEMVS